MVTGVLLGGLVAAPAASASTGGSIVPAGFLGLPSLHSIIQAIANGFFGALAGALVPGFLKHGTVAAIQHLVALPDPASWGHVSQLQGDMTYLGVTLLPVSLAVGTLRYWMVGLTGAAHPAGAIGRCAAATGVLVIYRWVVEQTVAGTNTVTHAILAFPVVGNGLQRIIGVLFGGALLTGAGGVFGAFLVIIGVLFAAGLFALQVLLTVVLAVLIVAGPPLIALSAIPELSHLARTWAHALMAVTLVPLGWTVLFATAGALCLDATSFTGGAGGLPGHVAAAFAGLITFVLAVKLPLMLLGELRHLLSAASLRGRAGSGGGQSSVPGADRVRTAHARLRAVAFEGVPSVGRSVGRAAGAMGAPEGGPAGAARRGLAGAARRGGILPGVTAGAGGAAAAAGGLGGRGGAGKTAGGGGVRGRLARAGRILADSPRDARVAVVASSRKSARNAGRGAGGRAAPRRTGSSRSAGKSPGGDPNRLQSSRPAGRAPASARARPVAGAPPRPAPKAARAKSVPAAASTPRRNPTGTARLASEEHPGRKVNGNARRDAPSPAPPASKTRKPAGRSQPRPGQQPPPPSGASGGATGGDGSGPRGRIKRRPRPRSGS